MAIEIIGESVKAAFMLELIKGFSGVTVYSEQQTRPIFPHFFIEQLTLSQREERKGYWWLSYLMTIRYRLTEEPFLKPNLELNLDSTSLKMMDLNNIYIANIPVRIRNARTEKVDGVLHYFANILIQVNKEEINKIKQWQLKQTTILQGGN